MLLCLTEYIYMYFVIVFYFNISLCSMQIQNRMYCACEVESSCVVHFLLILSICGMANNVWRAKLGMLHSTVVIFFISGPGRLLNLSLYWMWNWKRPNFHLWYILAVSKSVCVCTLLNTTVSGRDGEKLNTILMIEFATKRSKLSL